MSQRLEARVDPFGVARTPLAVTILAAHRAQALAVLAAQRLHRQREKELLPDDIAQVEHIILVERRAQAILGDRLAVLVVRVVPVWPVWPVWPAWPAWPAWTAWPTWTGCGGSLLCWRAWLAAFAKQV